jgi:IS605 OrfB family transposase
MMQTVTKTLEATLAPPTQHKERKLRDTLTTYREALTEAFDTGCTTQTAVNDIVTPYDLTSYAKDALKSYVPQLRQTYDAGELADDHPVRFTNRGWRLDYDEAREHAYCWRVPQAGRGNSFWIPLRVNPEQHDHWAALRDDRADVGEFRLHRDGETWVLHITTEYEVEAPDYSASDSDVTPVGFDIGESKLLVGCALADNDAPTDPLLFDGGRARQLRKEMHTTLQRLQERNAADWRTDERLDHYQNALTDLVEKASREAVEYAQQFDRPVVVMEDLSYIRERLDYGKYMNRRLHSWAFARLQSRVEDKAREAGIPVKYVNPAYTSQTCHECGHLGTRPEQAEFRCTNEDCWVFEYQADINAAANIAAYVNPWGETCSLKPNGDDSPRDGSGSDTATTHRETSENPSKTTLSAYSGSKPTASND